MVSSSMVSGAVDLRGQSAARPRRSVLYVPGSNRRALEKARTLPSDALILDLEDAVNPDAKEAARALVFELLGDGGYEPQEVAIRINGLHSRWYADDLAMVASANANAIVLPKVESAADVQVVEAALNRHRAPQTLAVWTMMETPRAVLRAHEIASASPRLTTMVMGTSDLANDLHASHTRSRTPLLSALGLCLLAARAEGLSIVDGVHLDLRDDEGFEDLCVQGAEMGFDGKTLIHPKQIAMANAAFAPSEATIERARRIIDAYAEAEAVGRGVVLLDGRLVEALHVDEARRCLALAAAIAGRQASAS